MPGFGSRPPALLSVDAPAHLHACVTAAPPPQTEPTTSAVPAWCAFLSGHACHLLRHIATCQCRASATLCCAHLCLPALQVNVYNRGSHTKPGKNQRDEPANIGIVCQPCEGGYLVRGRCAHDLSAICLWHPMLRGHPTVVVLLEAICLWHSMLRGHPTVVVLLEAICPWHPMSHAGHPHVVALPGRGAAAAAPAPCPSPPSILLHHM